MDPASKLERNTRFELATFALAKRTGRVTAALAGCSKDAVRAACERGELEHHRDRLNAVLILCSSARRWLAQK